MSTESRMGSFWRSNSAIALLLVVFLALTAAYSIAVPLFEGPDEDDHFRYVKYLADHRVLPVQLFQAGGGEAGHQGWQPPLYYALGAIAISPISTIDFDQHLWRNPGASFQGDRACCGRNLYYHTRTEDFPYSGTTLAVHLARLVTIAFGLITVAAVYALMLTILPGGRLRALSAAAVVGFNPSFLYSSALVSNDVPLAALCSLALLSCARLLRGMLEPSLKNFVILGTVIALAVMIKTTALGLIPIAFAVGVWLAMNQPSPITKRRTILFKMSVGIITPVLFLTGWWFARNQILYGDPMAYRLIYASAIFPRESPLTWAEFFQINLPWMWQTFWGGPTPGDMASSLLFALGVLSVLCAAGAVLFFFGTKEKHTRTVMALVAAWLILIFAVQVEFIRTSGGTDQGRYLFPAIGSFAALWLIGLETWTSALSKAFSSLTGGRGRLRFFHPKSIAYAVCIAAFLILSLLVLFVNTIPAYARPPQLTESVLVRAEKELNYNFSNLVSLRGYSLSSRNLRRTEPIRVTLYWQSLASTSISFRVFVHLVGENGHVAGGKDVIPVQGAFPTVLWQPGDWVEDSVDVFVAPDAVPGLYRLEIGLYPFGRPEDRLNIAGSDQDHVLVDSIEVRE